MTSTMSSQIGAHAFIWTPRWDRSGARRAASQAAAAGFDLIEIPLLDPSVVDVTDTLRVLERLNLRCTCSLGLPASAHLPAAPDEARAFLTAAIDVAAGLGSSWLTGALYANLGTFTGSEPTSGEFEIIARTLHDVSGYAADRDLNLGLELINRYETYVLNTADQAINLIERIDAPNVYAHLDTFHTNIEEPAFTHAIRRLGHRLGYVHIAESDRGVIGGGHVPFREVFSALSALGYCGPLVIEAFFRADPTIRRATASWRTYDIDPQEFACAARDFVARLSSPEESRT